MSAPPSPSPSTYRTSRVCYTFRASNSTRSRTTAAKSLSAAAAQHFASSLLLRLLLYAMCICISFILHKLSISVIVFVFMFVYLCVCILRDAAAAAAVALRAVSRCPSRRLVLSSLAPFAFVRTFGSTFILTHTHRHTHPQIQLYAPVHPLSPYSGVTLHLYRQISFFLFFWYLTRFVHRYGLSISNK